MTLIAQLMLMDKHVDMHVYAYAYIWKSYYIPVKLPNQFYFIWFMGIKRLLVADYIPSQRSASTAFWAGNIQLDISWGGPTSGDQHQNEHSVWWYQNHKHSSIQWFIWRYVCFLALVRILNHERGCDRSANRQFDITANSNLMHE